MSLLTRDRSFYRTFFSLTFVIAMQNLISFTVSLADNVMLGSYSQAALSGVAIANQIQFLVTQFIAGVDNGLATISAQYWGKRQVEPIRRIISICLWISLIGSVLMLIVVRCFPETCMAILTDEPGVIAEGAKYLRIICWTYLLMSVRAVLLAALRSVQTVKVGFAVTCTALFVNVGLNYCLIYGRFGFPEMGVEGAALATLISRIIETGIVVVYIFLLDKKIRWRPTGMLRLDKQLLRDYIRVGVPLIFSATTWGIATSAQTAILGRLGGDAIAANSIAVTIFQVVSVVTYGSATASAIVIGKTVGQGDIPRVKSYTKTLQVLYIFIGIATSAMLWLSKDIILSFYSVTPAAYELAQQFIAVLCVTVIGTSYQVTCLTGIITGGGETDFVLKNDLFHQWVIVLPAAFLSAFVFHFPPVVTFFCLKSDQILKCLVAFIKVNRYHWIHDLTHGSTGNTN